MIPIHWCDFFINLKEHETGMRCPLHEDDVIKELDKFWEEYYKDNNNEYLRRFVFGLYDDGRTCPIPYLKHISKRMLAEYEELVHNPVE